MVHARAWINLKNVTLSKINWLYIYIEREREHDSIYMKSLEKAKTQRQKLF